MTRNPAFGNWHNFYRQIWRIERQIPEGRGQYHRVGHDGWPDKELVRFKTSQHMGFAGQDIAQARFDRNDQGLVTAELAVNTLGLTGARGALPSHYTELVLTQLKDKAPELKDFLDIFNHRLLSLFYRAWEKTQPAVHQEREQQDIFTTLLRTLTGADQHWQLLYGGAQARQACSGQTLCRALRHLTGMAVTLKPLVGGWKPVAAEEQSALPSRRAPLGQHARLGEAMVGSRAWVADQGIALCFHPKDGKALAELLPGGRLSAAVGALVGRLAGRQLSVGYRMQVRAGDLNGSRLGQLGRLGEDSFIAALARPDQQLTLSFKPRKG
ncbi:type VI secretion system baseplate subunit TssG [Gallaecimonas kandeliae]|uniref:type VI secretion system baseplate subunit TssG n=1 Tax=Gallaecimonas kandeliae TaxID=3029055 RepID=UPI002649D70B|nr:type VI secretion system baseplate subunit TssG [Gallaecimonas kandeliae]WKE65735.1 type VI secretion system baseplate subunit TssG [Gallaecimonas kandeliae]